MTKTTPSFTISPVRTEKDLKDTINLFYAYAKSLGIDLSFQNFDNEMSSMPGKYAPPTGELLLARDRISGDPLGCVALRPLPHNDMKVAEMKRLYVVPAGRGTGLGRALALRVIEVAAMLGYTELRLDTLSSMQAAQALYKALGFEEMERYYKTPMENTVFLRLKLPHSIVEEAKPATTEP